MSDFDQMSNVPGLFVGGEVGWAYHGANRLGANSLLSACVDGWFTLPSSIPDYLAPLLGHPLLDADDPAVADTVADVQRGVQGLIDIHGEHGPDWFHRRLGDILYADCGVSRSADGLRRALDHIERLRAQFYADLRVVGDASRLNQELERAGRVADSLDLGRLMCLDALDRDESCGAHFRVEHALSDGEAARDDEHWCSVSAWERDPASPAASAGDYIRHDERLHFSAVPLQTRNYETS